MTDAAAVRSTQIKIAAVVLLPLCLWTALIWATPYSPSFDLLLKVVLWGIPAYLYPRWVEHANRLEFLRLNEPPRWKWIFLSTIFLAAYTFLIRGGKIAVQPVSQFYVISAVVVSPVIEEMAFRGAILGLLSRVMGFAAANTVAAVLFLLYHLPLWLQRGQGVSLLGCLWVIFFALAVGCVVSRSKSLWTCAIIHAVQNLLFGIL